jgi:hypothetical protein
LTKYKRVWQYVDPHNNAKELNLNDYADVEDIDEDDIDVCQDDDMTDNEFELYCRQIKKRRAKRIASNMKIVHAALKMTAGISAISTCTRDVVKFLAARFDSTLNLQSQNVACSVVDRSIVACVNRSIVDCPIVDFLNWFQMNWFNDED